MRIAVLGFFLASLLASPVIAQEKPAKDPLPLLPPSPKQKATPAVVPPPQVKAADVEAAQARCIELLLSMQEGGLAGKPEATPAEWPYEGVYRVGGQIPVGYRIGGTSIVALALVDAPGYDQDPKRQEAIARAIRFVCAGIEHPLMSEADYDGTYDVRGWGYIYGLRFLANLKERNLVPADLAEVTDKSAAWYLNALQKTEMPQTGGWNYARPSGRDTVGSPSPFMTPAALQALFEAKRAGMTIDDAVVTRGLDFLDKARSAVGSFTYSGELKDKSKGDPIPGAVGRMLASESALSLGGRSSPDRVRGALDAFFVHWDWLDKRRAQEGTHVPPYSVAPYYFMFAHHYAAVAIELLPKPERAEYRRRLYNQLFSVRLEDGSWDDRVFRRTANYGTAIALNVITMPKHGPEATWAPANAPAENPTTK